MHFLVLVFKCSFIVSVRKLSSKNLAIFGNIKKIIFLGFAEVKDCCAATAQAGQTEEVFLERSAKGSGCRFIFCKGRPTKFSLKFRWVLS